MRTEPLVSIVIINWNGIVDTIECINSLTRIDYSNFEIIVVDNGSENNEAQAIKGRYEDITVIELKRNLGFANANNVGILIGIQHNAQYILLLNNDTVVDKMFLRLLISVGESNPQIGILGSTMYYYNDSSKIWFSGGKINLYTRHTQQDENLDLTNYSFKSTDYIAGACMLIKTTVLRKIGLLPREYFLGWEDIDFCISARRSGYVIAFVPASQIWHKVSHSYRRKNLTYKQVFFGFRNRIILRFKYLNGFRFFIFLLIQTLAIIPIHIVYYLLIYRDPGRIIPIFLGLRSGLRDMRSRKCIFTLEYH